MAGVNIKMLASKLNISIATVSKALHDSHEISLATKQRVLALAKELNYVANPYASSLKGKSSKTIAVVIPEVADSFFALSINGIESIAQKNGYHVLIYLTHESFSNEQAILKVIQNGRVDGVIMSVSSETTHTDHIQELQQKGIPVVFFDRVCEGIDTVKITTNDFQSGFEATQHLIECGCKNISFFTISDKLAISQHRLEGHRQALKDHQMEFNEKDIVFCNNDEAFNYEAIKNLMKQKKHPDGVIASVEKLATTFYVVCKEFKISIPDKVKVIGFSNLAAAAILNPSLTTVTQPAFDMGNAAASGLFRILGEKVFNYQEESMVMPSALVVRDSTSSGK
ncbi:MAG: LacI family DNA-binding transcriptional regulator [Flavitalea sp.]